MWPFGCIQPEEIGGSPLKLPRLLSLVLLASFVGLAVSQPVPVRHLEGREHGFVVIHDEAGHPIGSGEVTQSVEGDRVTYRMIYRLRDGSVDDETTVFSQQRNFALISDHHIQRGSFFSQPLDLTIEANGHSIDRAATGSGKASVEENQQELEPGTVVNGMMGALMTDLDPHAPPFKLPILSPTRKPRLFHLVVSSAGQGSFTVAGLRRTATIFRMHADLGGVAGVVAPLIGKQPKDVLIWVLEGDVPVVVRVVGQMAEGGPMVDIQFAGASFPRTASR
jgi:hypothetical protein